jgi:hypothetical protein
MATETVNQSSSEPNPQVGGAAVRPSLREVAHSQSNALHDVRALLAALLATPDIQDHNYPERLAFMAEEKVAGVQRVFDPYI